MDDFECFITNKRVALVGPSYHLEGKGFGKKIDSIMKILDGITACQIFKLA